MPRRTAAGATAQLSACQRLGAPEGVPERQTDSHTATRHTVRCIQASEASGIERLGSTMP